jgi:1-acyl-sn-glycerol-3-phosphate acyltransferase
MAVSLPRRDRLALYLQREVGRCLAPLWIPVCAGILRLGFRWRIQGQDDARRRFRALRQSRAPLLVCANHLTMLDSFLVAHALGSPAWFVTHYGALPWNTPERENFANTWWKRPLVWLMKCVPVARGGDRRAVGAVLDRIVWLMQRGEVALLFPEGGRSRTGRVDAGATTYGVGRIVRALPGCRVACVYLRGDGQQSWSVRPRAGERFRVSLEVIEPKSDHRGLRGSLDVTRQILQKLHEMEQRHFDGR